MVPANEALPRPVKVRVVPELFRVRLPLMLRVEDKVSVTEPLIVKLVQTAIEFTVGALPVVLMEALSIAVGYPVLGDQLALLFQLLFPPLPVQL